VTHYDVLGVGPGASPDQIRTAFRRMAREHHPDTSAAGSAEAMAPINEAWRVLGDPVTRADYDRSLRLTPPDAPVLDAVSIPSTAPSSFPWRFLAGMAVVGIGFALFGVFTYRAPTPGPPDQLLERGSCVVIETNGDVSEVNCESDHDGVVDSIIGAAETCLTPFEPHRDRQGLGVACVRLGQ
jgi:molecular chaperone DnaJ